ncbi:MAG: hypothetical protein ACI4A8_07605 [Muribaculaceae bacterium]
MRIKILIAAVLSMLMLGSCSTSKRVEGPREVSYEVARNYFVRNDVAGGSFAGRIDTQEQFDAIFGAAAVMGPDGKPTEIDFSNSYVIAVAKSVTDRTTVLNPVRVVADVDGTVTLSYRTIVGSKQSYSMQPALIVVVSRRHSGTVKFNEIID